MESVAIIGREKEKQELQRCLQSSEAELVVVYGRRRVGKTFLVREFFGNTFAFQLTGLYNQPKSVQLYNFALALSEYSHNQVMPPVSWLEAFSLLRTYLESLPSDDKKVVFIDEMPWLDTRLSDFLSAFEWFWNGWGASRRDLVLIACGSATSWMADKILANKGGLFNRATSRIYLRPFTLNETEQYLLSRGIQWSRYDIAECYMVMGGIPFYLRLLSPRLSYTANVDELFFKKKGKLWDEFTHLYNTLFTNADAYIQIVEALSTKRMGMTRNEIIASTHLPNNGVLTKMLNNLVDSDFIRPYNFYGRKKRDTIYQLSDYYSIFYFRFIKGGYGKDEQYWTHTLDSPQRRAWAGYTFEQVCKDHVNCIKRAIGISAVLSEVSSWHQLQGEQRAQIDLLIDRRDRVVNICEVKYALSPFVIDKDYDMVLRSKIETFRQATHTNKALHLTLIATYGLKENAYSSIAQSVVTLDDLFS